MISLPKTGVETVTRKQFYAYAKRLERIRMKADGRSLTYTAIARAAQDCILEVQDSGELLIVSDDWRDQMKDTWVL